MKLLIFPLLASLSLSGTADILTLKDGTKLDAIILDRTLDEYELEVRLTKSVSEKRTIKRADVVDIEKVSLSDTMFDEQLAALLPVPPFEKVQEYDKRISAVDSFLTAHAVSKAGVRAKAMKEELEAERDLIAAGGMRVKAGDDGVMSREELDKDLLGIEAEGAAVKFRKLVAARAYLAGLRQYELLERDFLGTQAHRDAIPLMRKLSATYAKLLNQELQNFAAREKEGKMTMEQLSGNDRRRAEQANQARKAKHQALLEREEEAGYTWFSVDARDEESLRGTIEDLQQEVERLAQLQEDLADYQDTAELYRMGWAAADGKEKEELEKILDEMDAVSAPAVYLDKLIDHFDPTINNPPAEEDSPEEDEDSEEDSETTE